MYYFETRSFWRYIGAPINKLHKKFEKIFGENDLIIDDEVEAAKLLSRIISAVQMDMIEKFKTKNIYEVLLKLHCIFGEVHGYYLEEKKDRSKLVKLNLHGTGLTDTFIENRNITRNIIDACNIWIENCLLYQHNHHMTSEVADKEFRIDYDLMFDLYIYGVASQNLSLLMLSKNLGSEEKYYGIKISPNKDIPVEALKYSPVIFFNTAIMGNQDALVETTLTREANETMFGKGFLKEHGAEFLLFLAAIVGFQNDLLRCDNKALTIIGKDYFIDLVESYTTPKINGQAFYNSFVLDKTKIKSQLRDKEDIIWRIGTNEYRHEIRPFIGLEDGNILVSYAAMEQAKQLWVSYFSNGGMCYTNTSNSLTRSMESRNKELADILVDRIREELKKHYTPKVDEKDVKYHRIFGEKEINYGDFDIVFFTEDTKELFLIEAKYFSDSLNSSGMVTDYKKLFQKDGYYDKCRRRYDLVLSEPYKIKKFIGTDEIIKVHLIFLSSKPIELEIQDKDKVVTFLSLRILDKYLTGNLISNEDDTVVRPTIEI